MILLKHQVLLLIRVLWDFVRGMYRFSFIGPYITIFGSARLRPDTPIYQMARALGATLGHSGFTIMTGGGPGLMEAVNRGVREVGGKSVACRISLPFEQAANQYLDHYVTFRYFFVRKVMMLRHSCALVVLPGGLGTLDELFEVLTLVQTRKIAPLPIVFLGKSFWTPLLDIFERLVSAGMISIADMDLIIGSVMVTDDVHEALAHIKTDSVDPFRLRGHTPPRTHPSLDRSHHPLH
jgi:uncharacterized protein (TIGR00730 family)